MPSVTGVQLLFLSLLALTVFRVSGLWILSLSYGLFRTRRGGPLGRISLIVPAYNEQGSIAKCLDSLSKLNYGDLEIVVVDDGSSDATLEIARRYEGPKVKVIHQENRGKPEALNAGIRASTGKIVLTVDADTRLNPNSLDAISTRFSGNPQLGALAGNVKVDEARGLVKRLQDLEYASSIGYIRKAQSVLGAVMIVPGPIAALRREAVEKAGFFSGETFAEDFDMTLCVLKRGFKVQYEEKAIAYTIAPANVQDLMKQRRRWYRGMVQVLAKHEDMLFRTRYGVAGIYGVPNMWFETISPVLNMFLLLFAVLAGYLENQWTTTLYGLGAYWILQTLIVVSAVGTDKERRFSLILLSPLLVFYNTFLDGIRTAALTEELLTLKMKWETPKR